MVFPKCPVCLLPPWRRAAYPDRTVLEAKARAYERLQTGTAALEDDATNERFLVNFQQKAIDDVTRRRQAAAERSSAESPPPPPGPATAADEW